MRISGIWIAYERVLVLVVASTNIIKTLNLVWGEAVYALFNHCIGDGSTTCYASSDIQAINGFLIDRTEISIAQFQRFACATEFESQAEHAGVGEVLPGAGNKSLGGLGKLQLVSSPTLGYLQFSSHMTSRLPTTSGVERVRHPRLKGLKRLISSAGIYSSLVLLPRQNILIRQVIRRSALTAFPNVNIDRQ